MTKHAERSLSSETALGQRSLRTWVQTPRGASNFGVLPVTPRLCSVTLVHRSSRLTVLTDRAYVRTQHSYFELISVTPKFGYNTYRHYLVLFV